MGRLLYAQDYETGALHDLGSHKVTADEITAFGRTYDPQPYHVDEAAGRASAFGGLIASGWNTAAIWMRLYVTTLLPDAAAEGTVEGSPGVDEVRFLEPVRPGDVLSGTCEIIASLPSLSAPDFRIIRNRGRLVNAAGTEVLTLILNARFRSRPKHS
ncbi:MaoC family dehydratase [Streptomyces celluloflavus]|uniref:MaoC family dehydratase n=1 Tax=Streptomyces celluloflavus TaxID=58344 RepID=A0ABW7R9J2_9ACTN|nr:MaoC family dehydratase [Streptomyces kasugaensis]WSK16567.1 MaoC family dehydratase [Streptomyces celluloflavus]